MERQSNIVGRRRRGVGIYSSGGLLLVMGQISLAQRVEDIRRRQEVEDDPANSPEILEPTRSIITRTPSLSPATTTAFIEGFNDGNTETIGRPTGISEIPDTLVVLPDNSTPTPPPSAAEAPPQNSQTRQSVASRPTTTAEPTPTASASESSAPKKGLSPAVIGGITGGCLFIFLTAISIFFFMFWNRRRKARGGSPPRVFEKDFKQVVSNDSHSDFGNSLRDASPAPRAHSSQKEFLPPIKSVTPLPFSKSPSPPPAEGATRGIQETQERDLPAVPGASRGQFTMHTERELPNAPARNQFQQPRQVPTYNPAAYAQQQQAQHPQQQHQYNHPLQTMNPYNPPQLQKVQPPAPYRPDQFRSHSPHQLSYTPPPPPQQQNRNRTGSVSSNGTTDSWVIPMYAREDTPTGSGLPPLSLKTVPEIRTQVATPSGPAPGSNSGGDVSPVSPISTDGFDFFGGGASNNKSQGRPETMISQPDTDGQHGIGLALLPPTPHLPSSHLAPENDTRSPLSLKRSSDDSFYSFRGSTGPPLDPSFPLPPGITHPEPSPAPQRTQSVVWRQNVNEAKEAAQKQIVEGEQRRKKRPEMLKLDGRREGSAEGGRLGSPSFWKALKSPRSPGKSPRRPST